MDKVFELEGDKIIYKRISVREAIGIISSVGSDKLSGSASIKEALLAIDGAMAIVEPFIISAEISGKQVSKEDLLGDSDNMHILVQFVGHILKSVSSPGDKKK